MLIEPGAAGRLRYVLKLRRKPISVAAWLRMWRNDLAHVFRTGGEICQDCGRDYVLWSAPDELYEAVYGSLRGLLCPLCFDRRALAKGVRVMFKAANWPEVRNG